MLFCAISQTTFSQNEYAISSIGYPQGLSNSAVISIYQDNLGFMWFGTYDGLNNYDGKSMQIYRTDSDLGLLNNYIQSINGANNESLWLSTNLGISRFSIKKDTVIKSYQSFIGDYILCSNRKGNTWVLDNKNVYFYNNFADSFQEVSGKDMKFTNNLSFVDDNGSLWMFSSSTNNVYKYQIDNFNTEKPNFSIIGSIYIRKELHILSFKAEFLIS